MDGNNMKYFFMVLAIVVCSFVQRADNQGTPGMPGMQGMQGMQGTQSAPNSNQGNAMLLFPINQNGGNTGTTSGNPPTVQVTPGPSPLVAGFTSVPPQTTTSFSVQPNSPVTFAQPGTPSLTASTSSSTGSTTGTTTTTTTTNSQCASAVFTLYISLLYMSLQASQYSFCFRVTVTGFDGFHLEFDFYSRDIMEDSKIVIELLTSEGYYPPAISVSTVQQTSCTNPSDAYKTMLSLRLAVISQIESLITLYTTTCKDSAKVLKLKLILASYTASKEAFSRRISKLTKLPNDPSALYDFDQSLVLKYVNVNQACTPEPSQLVLYQKVPKVRTILADYTDYNLEYAKCGYGYSTGRGYSPSPSSCDACTTC